MGVQGWAVGRRRRAVALLLLLVLGAGGCYRSVPLNGAPEPGTRVVVSLTQAGQEAMANQIGPQTTAVEGETARITAEEWSLLMLNTRQGRGQELPWNREAVSFSPAYFAKVERVELDRTRTYLTAGVVAIGVLLLGRQFVKGWGAGDDGNNGEVPGQ